jgi:hypothetical protein
MSTGSSGFRKNAGARKESHDRVLPKSHFAGDFLIGNLTSEI